VTREWPADRLDTGRDPSIAATFWNKFTDERPIVWMERLFEGARTSAGLPDAHDRGVKASR
jgi:hypothetical protein